ncbi:TPA: hypothetical protein EYP66_07710 [Candidatus Poribacteria bacterium]|nr:hypothetical protein [Candidatus Poribacteria bacterium]
MRFSILSEKLQKLSTRDYRRIGFRGNPAYSGLRKGDDVEVRIPREPLESTIKSMIDEYANGGKPKHIYLFSREGGAGKSHANRIMVEYCGRKNLPFILWDDDEDIDNSVQAVRYLIHVADVNKVVLFRECDAPENFYTKLLSIEDAYIIGHGHEPERELRGTGDSFKVFDLEEDYPLSEEDIHRLLREYLRKLTIRPILTIPDEVLERISKFTTTPGNALNMLGALLAVAAYKANNGKEPRITDDDIQNCCNLRVAEALSYY